MTAAASVRVSFGVESRNYSGNGEWRQAEFMLNFNLPLFNRSKSFPLLPL
jgi:hypothetical protein